MLAGFMVTGGLISVELPGGCRGMVPICACRNLNDFARAPI